MIPWQHLDTAKIPNGGTLDLWARDGEFVIRAGKRALMTSRAHGSEEALAELSCERIRHIDAPRVLIGGLGMGYTLAAALRHLPSAARVVVAEVVPAVVAWNRGPVAHLAGHPLGDSRVAVLEQDICAALRTNRSAYDAILLDVDNGPEGLTLETNGWLYRSPGLKALFRALRAGGVLAVWSASPAPEFTVRLREQRFKVQDVEVRSGSGKGARHVIWLARRP